MPLSISIAIPVGNWHPFLPECLESLRLEALGLGPGIVNVALLDASGDERVARIAEQHSSWLHTTRHRPDKGQSDAIMEGWALAPGEILGWLNADDRLFPGALARVLDAFAQDQQADVLYGHSTILDEASDMTGYHWSVEPPGARLLESGIISQPSCFFRRSACDRVGGLDTSLHYTMDWDLWIRLYQDGARFGFIDDILSSVLWASDTKTASFNSRRREELKRIIRTHAPAHRQKAIFRSFAIQNVMDRMRPEGLRRMIERALIRGRNSIYGIAGDGRLSREAILHLAHYGPGSMPGLTLFVEGAQAISDIRTADGRRLGWSSNEHSITIRLHDAVAPGTPLALHLELGSDASKAWFRKARWQPGL